MEKKQNENFKLVNFGKQSSFYQWQSPNEIESKKETNPNNPAANKNECESKNENEIKSSTFSQSNCRVRVSKEKLVDGEKEK